jgi:hypothetical protein
MANSNYPQPFMQIVPLSVYPEIHDLIRENFPSATMPVHNNMYTILCSILFYPKFAVSRKHEHYPDNKEIAKKDNWYTRYHAVKAQNELQNSNWITIKKGYRSGNGFKGMCSVVGSTRYLEDILGRVRLKPTRIDTRYYPILTYERHMLNPDTITALNIPQEGVLVTKDLLIEHYHKLRQLNNTYFSRFNLDFQKGKVIRLEDLTVAELRDLSRSTDVHHLSMAQNVFMTTMFSKHGQGRLYQKSFSYQHVKKTIRPYLTINSAETSEADFSGMHVNVLYFLNNMKNPYVDDPYAPVMQALNLPSQFREHIKKAVIVAINTATYSTYTKAMVWNHLPYVREMKNKGITLRSVYGAIISSYKVLENLDSSQRRYIPDILMFHESNIMKNMLFKLKEKNLLGLPIHDAIISPKNNIDTIRKLMEDSYFEYTGNNIRVKVI